MINKKGIEKLTSIYWFFILIIVAFGVWAMAYAYFMHPMDIREVESAVLLNKVADCISQNGKMPEYLFDSEGNFTFTSSNFESICHFNFQVEDEWDWRTKEQYYVNISFFDISLNKKFSEVVFGNPQIQIDWISIQKKLEIENPPRGIQKRLYVLDNKNKQTLVEIFVGVRKTEKNVKM